jgi:hypothetical protein
LPPWGVAQFNARKRIWNRSALSRPLIKRIGLVLSGTANQAATGLRLTQQFVPSAAQCSLEPVERAYQHIEFPGFNFLKGSRMKSNHLGQAFLRKTLLFTQMMDIGAQFAELRYLDSV